MDNIWARLKLLYEKEPATRKAFEEICYEVLTKTMPGVSLDLLKPSYQEEHLVGTAARSLYHAKFILDDLNNSRKAQIRKAFSFSVDLYAGAKITLNQWILCLPVNLNDEDRNWWSNWSTRVALESKMEILLYEGTQIIELLKSQGRYDYWFTTAQIFTDSKPDVQDSSEEESLEDSIEDTNTFEAQNDFMIDETEDAKMDVTNDQEITDKEPSKNTTPLEEITEQIHFGGKSMEISDKTSIDPEKENQGNKQQAAPTIYILKGLDTLKKERELILMAADHLTDKQKEQLNLRTNTYSKADDPQKVDVSSMTKDTVVNLAENFKFNSEYEEALLLLENIPLICESYQYTESKLVADKVYCERKITIYSHVLWGDIHFVKQEFKLALESFELALQLEQERPESNRKYNEACGEVLIERKKYAEARLFLEKALSFDPQNASLIQRINYVKVMAKGEAGYSGLFKFLNPITRNYYESKAQQYLGSGIVNTDKASNKMGKYGKVAGIALLVLVIISIPYVLRNYTNLKPKSAKSEAEDLVEKAEAYEKKIEAGSVQFYDSVILTYKKVLVLKPGAADIIKRLSEIDNFKNIYLYQVQENLEKDSSSYFISMRMPTEGLRLFKYVSDPNDGKKKGKYGYVDSSMNVVIPPYFDFDHKSMNMAGEQFKDGKAYVCMVDAGGDTLFFYINKEGKLAK